MDDALPVAERDSVEAGGRERELPVQREPVRSESHGAVEARLRIPAGVHLREVEQETAEPAGVAADANPERPFGFSAQAQRSVQVHLQEIGLKVQPVEMEPVLADAELRVERQGELRLFPETEASRPGPDLAVNAGRFRDPEIDGHVIHPDFPRRGETPIAGGRARHRNAVRGKRQAARQRFEPRPGGSGIGAWRAPVVESPKTQPLDRQTLEMKTRHQQGPQTQIPPDLGDRKNRGRRSRIQRFPSHLQTAKDERPLRKRDPEAAGRHGTIQRRGEPGRGQGQQPVLVQTAGDDGRDGGEQEQQATGPHDPGAAESARRASRSAHLDRGALHQCPGQTSSAGASSAPSPGPKLPPSRSLPSASMAQ